MQRMLLLAAALLVACPREIPVQRQSVIPAGPPPKAVRAVYYYQGTAAADAVAEIRTKVGEPFRVLRIDIGNDYVSLEAQDPKKKENVDKYEISHGEMKPSEPVRLIGETDSKTLEANLFDPAEVDFSKIPELIRTGDEKVQLEGRTFDGVTVKRDMWEEGRPIQIRLDYSGTRKSGSLEADRHGQHVKVDTN